MARNIVDEEGFMLEGTNLLLYWPGFNAILCYKVIYRHNRFFEDLPYGPLPYTASGHEAGVVPASSTTGAYKFNWIDNRRRGHEYTNMFYFEKADRLMHVFMTIKPFMLRNYLHYPEGTTLLTYLDGVTNKPDTGDDFGFFRESYELVYIPFLEATFETYNNTNIDLRTYVDFKYAEYDVELVRDREEMKRMWTEKIPVKKIVQPAYAAFKDDAFKQAYGIRQPYPVKDVMAAGGGE